MCAREDRPHEGIACCQPEKTLIHVRERRQSIEQQEGDMADDITAFFGGGGCSRLVLPNGGQRKFSVGAPSDCQRIFSWDAGVATTIHNGRKQKERAANMRMAYFDHYKQ